MSLKPPHLQEPDASFYLDMARLLSEVHSLAIAFGCMAENGIPEVDAAPTMTILRDRISAARALLEQWHTTKEVQPAPH